MPTSPPMGVPPPPAPPTPSSTSTSQSIPSDRIRSSMSASTRSSRSASMRDHVRATHDADEARVLDHRQALHRRLGHELRRLRQVGVGVDRDGQRGHHLSDARRGGRRETGSTSRWAPWSTTTITDNVGLAHHADQATRVVDDWHRRDRVLCEQPRRTLRVAAGVTVTTFRVIASRTSLLPTSGSTAALSTQSREDGQRRAGSSASIRCVRKSSYPPGLSTQRSPRVVPRSSPRCRRPTCEASPGRCPPTTEPAEA